MMSTRPAFRSVFAAGFLGFAAGCGFPAPLPQNVKPQLPQPPQQPVKLRDTEGIAPTEVVNPENVSLELLRDVYDSARMEVTLDVVKRHIRINEEVVARCTVSESKEQIQFIAYYDIEKNTPRADRMELVSRINERYVLIRAGIDKDGDLWLDFGLVLKGGVSKKNIVQATRSFLTLVSKAITECNKDGIIK